MAASEGKLHRGSLLSHPLLLLLTPRGRWPRPGHVDTGSCPQPGTQPLSPPGPLPRGLGLEDPAGLQHVEGAISTWHLPWHNPARHFPL